MVRYLIIYFIALFLTAESFTQQVWVKQETPTNAWLYRCSFSDSLHGWAAGEEGVIIRTTNGGTNWALLNSPVDFYIYDIYFLNSRLGWALANDNFENGTAVLSTTNGGDNWNFYRYPDSTTQFFSIHFRDSLHGIMTGYYGNILRTSNGGVNWNIPNVDSSFSSYFPINKVSFKENLWIGVGGAYDILGAIWVSTDDGLNWVTTPVSGEPIHCFGILSGQKVVALGGDFEFGVILSKTSNTGANWQTEYLNTFGIPKGLSFRTPSEGWAVLSLSARFFYTLDTGLTWQPMDVPDTTGMYDIQFTDERNGYAVGLNGRVFKYNPKIIGITNNQTNIPKQSSLFQNYPNPFNPQTKIEYYLSKPAVVRIFVYDVTGKQVKEILVGPQPQGSNGVNFDGSNLSSGMYLYKIEAGDYSETKKMVILK